jgi:hypothetical protein
MNDETTDSRSQFNGIEARLRLLEDRQAIHDVIVRYCRGKEIKYIKSKYFYGLDHKDWDLWRREVWADGKLIVPEASTVRSGSTCRECNCSPGDEST